VEELHVVCIERVRQHPVPLAGASWVIGFLNGIGPRVGESRFGLISGFAYTAPYEDITLKAG
jgi:hypothetical protein